jgi:hypothetical protein
VARLYSNENFPAPVAEELRRLGHDVVSVLERGRAGEGVPDIEVLTLATAEDRAILTWNRRDFIRLHQQNQQHAGIIVCTGDTDFVGQALRFHAAIQAAGDLRCRLLRVNRPRK